MPEQKSFVRYSEQVERRAPDEDDTIDRIIASMTRESEVTAGRYGHAVRASHAKSTGLLKGELRVLEGLPGSLRLSCTWFFWTPICPTGEQHGEVQHERNRTQGCG